MPSISRASVNHGQNDGLAKMLPNNAGSVMAAVRLTRGFMRPRGR
jgi:hypothetical protein